MYRRRAAAYAFYPCASGNPWISALLFQVPPRDVTVFATAAGLLGATVLCTG
jgi:hypothetical protein